MLALKLRIPESENVARANLIKLHNRSIGEVGVDQSAERALADRVQGFGLGLDEVRHQSEGGSVADGGVFLVVTESRGGIGDSGAEALPVGFKLILAKFGWRGLVALLEEDVFGFLRVVAGGDDCLAVVDVEDVDVLADCGTAAALGGLGFFALGEDVNTPAGLEHWRQWLVHCPPLCLLAEVDVAGDLSVVGVGTSLFH